MAQAKLVVVQVPDSDEEGEIEKLEHLDIVAITEHGKDKSGAATCRWWNALEPTNRRYRLDLSNHEAKGLTNEEKEKGGNSLNCRLDEIYSFLIKSLFPFI